MKASILLPYENKWVALNKGRTKVLYSAKSMENLFKKIPQVKKDGVILHYVPPFDGHLSM